jgi:hypothetical protein
MHSRRCVRLRDNKANNGRVLNMKDSTTRSPGIVWIALRTVGRPKVLTLVVTWTAKMQAMSDQCRQVGREGGGAHIRWVVLGGGSNVRSKSDGSRVGCTITQGQVATIRDPTVSLHREKVPELERARASG